MIRSEHASDDPDPGTAAPHAIDARYRATLDTLLEPLIILRPVLADDGSLVDFTYDYANLAACAANRTTQAEQIGRRLLDALPQALPMGMFAAVAAVISTGEPLIVDGIHYLDTRDGEPVEHVVDVRLHRVGSSIVCTWRDVTEATRAQEALRLSETRFRLLADNTNDVVWTVGADEEVSYISPAVERFRGFTAAEAMLQQVEEVHPPESVAINLAYFEALDAALTAGLPPPSMHREMAYLHRDGSTVWADVHVIPRVGPDGGLIEVVGVSRDISERKRHEEAQRRFGEELERRVAERTAELEAANEELRSFSYSVSHDLRAPVRAVAGFAGILLRDSADRLDDDGRHKLANIVTAGETMGRLIDDLLSYTRVGQGAIHRDPLPLGPIVEQVRIALSPRLAETQGVIELVEGAAVPVGDRSLLDRILLNLAENALTYHRPGVSPHVTIGARPVGTHVEISVADNGIGIPRDAFDRIFDVFTRLSVQSESSRSGIGLATVRKAARAMGSEVTVESELGVGTTFRFQLPAAGVTAPDERSRL